MENARNESSEAVEVTLDTFAIVIKQTTLLLGQASLLMKDPRKAKRLLKGKAALLQEIEGHLSGKKMSFTHN